MRANIVFHNDDVFICRPWFSESEFFLFVINRYSSYVVLAHFLRNQGACEVGRIMHIELIYEPIKVLGIESFACELVIRYVLKVARA